MVRYDVATVVVVDEDADMNDKAHIDASWRLLYCHTI